MAEKDDDIDIQPLTLRNEISSHNFTYACVNIDQFIALLGTFFFVLFFSFGQRKEMSPPSDLFAKQIMRKIFNNQQRMLNSERVTLRFELVFCSLSLPIATFHLLS